MNKIAIIFVAVLLTLSILIRIDYTKDNYQTQSNKINKIEQETTQSKKPVNSLMLSNITYIKDNTLSLSENRLISAIISKDASSSVKLIQTLKKDIIYNYNYNNYNFKLPIIFLAIGSGNNEVIDAVLSNTYIEKNIATNIMIYDSTNGNTLITNLSPLAYSIYINRIDIAEKLINNGADVNQKLSRNRTAMFYVNSKASLDLLERNGADINALSTQGDTPLISAVIRNNVIAAFEFITKGVNPNQINNANATPLTIAIGNKNISMVKMLLVNGADANFFAHDSYSPLMASVANADLQTFHLLLNMGAEPNLENNLGKTCIYYMQSFNDQWTIWRTMINSLADTVDINHQDINGDTILHIYPERYLLYRELKPDLNIKNHQGNTPLHNLIQTSNNIDLIKLYIKDGADINKKNNLRQTPLDIAKLENKTAIIDILK